MWFRSAAVTLASLAAVLAFAQTDTSSIAVPPPPPLVAAPAANNPAPQAPAATPPPGLTQTTAPAAPSVTAGTTPAPPDVAPTPPNDWLPGNTAILGVLDKVDGSASQISIAVGGQANIGDLQVSVLSCVSRPPAEIPDSAIFLSVQANAEGATTPLYRGWMVRSTPGATVVGDAGETFRVISCS